jgi:hypothetical protein
MHRKCQILYQSGNIVPKLLRYDSSDIRYSNHFYGWNRYIWTGGEAIVGHFWILATNKPASVCIHISSSNTTNLLPHEFKQFCKALKTVMIKESQK